VVAAEAVEAVRMVATVGLAVQELLFFLSQLQNILGQLQEAQQ
jgi:hypothetical protein